MYLSGTAPKRIEANNIKQLFTTKHVGRKSESYTLDILTQEHQKIHLLSGFNSRDESLYIEQEVEKYLGIENVSVEGED